MENEYITAALIATIIGLGGKIIFDWLKNRKTFNYIEKDVCDRYREEIYNRLDRIEDKIDKILLYLSKARI